MNNYSFNQKCWPRGDLRIDELIEYFHVMKEAFRFQTLYDKDGRPVELVSNAFREMFEKRIDKRFPGIGVNLDFFSIAPRNRDENTVRFEIHTGTHPDEIFIDTYDISIGVAKKVPDFEYLRKSVKIFKPFESYLGESENEFRLNAYDRQQAASQLDKPVIIRGFHYLDESTARSIGGIEYCLRAPVWNVKRFCEGVLITLVPGLFDTDNPEHLRIQEDAMDYFNLL
jgi:hypothetical protein